LLSRCAHRSIFVSLMLSCFLPLICLSLFALLDERSVPDPHGGYVAVIAEDAQRAGITRQCEPLVSRPVRPKSSTTRCAPNSSAFALRPTSITRPKFPLEAASTRKWLPRRQPSRLRSEKSCRHQEHFRGALPGKSLCLDHIASTRTSKRSSNLAALRTALQLSLEVTTAILRRSC
jgi:hypothetical protein